MKLHIDQLSNHLVASRQGVYLIAGDEPLQVLEAGNAIRHSAKSAGFVERLTYHVDAHFDWQTFFLATNNLSLFAQQRIIELRFTSIKLGKEGGQALVDLFAQVAPDDVFILFMPKLDAGAQKTQWYTRIDQVGVVLQVWPIESARLPGWIMQRLRQYHVEASQAAVALLADHVEGNLLAAAQEIDKFCLQGLTYIDVDQVVASVENNARYDLFSVVDSTLQGDIALIVSRITSLKRTGAEPILVLWALTREVRIMIQITQALVQGAGFASVMKQYRVWGRREPLIRQAIKQVDLDGWQYCLKIAGSVDRILKGVEPGNTWDSLLNLALAMAGQVINREVYDD